MPSHRRYNSRASRMRALRRGQPAYGARTSSYARRVSPRLLATQDLRRRRDQGQRVTSLARIASVAAIFAATLFVGFAIASASAAVAAWNYFSEDLPSIAEFEARQFETTRIYDRNMNLLYE